MGFLRVMLGNLMVGLLFGCHEPILALGKRGGG